MQTQHKHRKALCTALLFGALTLPAAAAAAPVAVRVDDKPVAFTDVQPLIRSDRTYVPFRVIFEQMGAAVTWDEASQTITAVRGSSTVQFQVGKTDLRVTTDGTAQTMETDAPPFIEQDRTYVPIRFASQALGANVDWVQDTRTVLIVDVAQQMDAYADSFHTIDTYLAFAGASRSVNGSFTLETAYDTAMGTLPIKVTGTVAGSADKTATALTGTAAVDTEALRAAIIRNEGKDVISEQIEDLLTQLSGTACKAIFSRADGKVYLSGELLTQLGAAENGWSATPYAAAGGTELADLQRAVSHGSFVRYAAASAQEISLKEAPNATVSTVNAHLDSLKAAYGDSAFTAAGTDKILRNAAGTERLRLGYDAAGAVNRARVQGTGTGYNTTIDQDGTYTLQLTGQQANAFSFQLTLQTTGAGGETPVARPTGGITEIGLP